MAYNLAANTWSDLPASPLAPRAFPAGAWTGRELVVAGGARGFSSGNGKALRTGAAYNPATRTWRRLPPMPHPRYGATAVWDGKEVLFLGGHRAPGTSPAARGMAYNPTTNTWRDLPAMQFGRDRFTAVWTGRHVLVWGGVTGRTGTSLPPHGEAFNPTTSTWTALPMAPLAGRENPVSVWTGHQMITWGGDFKTTAYTDGAAFTPRTP
jgi:Kelch motif